MDVKLRDAVARSHQPQELPLGGFQGRIRHHVQQPDMQFPDVLGCRPLQAEDFLAFVPEALEARQIRIGNEWHGSAGSVHLCVGTLQVAYRFQVDMLSHSRSSMSLSSRKSKIFSASMV